MVSVEGLLGISNCHKVDTREASARYIQRLHRVSPVRHDIPATASTEQTPLFRSPRNNNEQSLIFSSIRCKLKSLASSGLDHCSQYELIAGEVMSNPNFS